MWGPLLRLSAWVNGGGGWGEKMVIQLVRESCLEAFRVTSRASHKAS